MSHFLSSVGVGAGIFMAAVLSPFSGALHTGDTERLRPVSSTSASTSVAVEVRDHDNKGNTAFPVSATSTACVGTAVAVREGVIDSAEATLTSALNTAYTTRASALATAYTQASTSAIRAGVKVAWSNFASTTRAARKVWNTSRYAAWKQFATSAKSCKAPSSVTDTQNMGLEVSTGE